MLHKCGHKGTKKKKKNIGRNSDLRIWGSHITQTRRGFNEWHYRGNIQSEGVFAGLQITVQSTTIFVLKLCPIAVQSVFFYFFLFYIYVDQFIPYPLTKSGCHPSLDIGYVMSCGRV